jgi:hypothetical protein
MKFRTRVLLWLAIVPLLGCGGTESEAIRRGVGEACSANAPCQNQALSCLTQFKGGYCGLSGCQVDGDCPAGSACVIHTDGGRYCFLVCAEKIECNLYRSADSEANCSSNVTFVNDVSGRKACVPPS